MTLWSAILLACACAFATKLAGYAIPARWLHNPRMHRDRKSTRLNSSH